MNKKITIISLIVFFALNTFASENSKYWSQKNESEIKIGEKERWITPKQYETYTIDLNYFKSIISKAPHISFVDVKDSKVIIDLPMPNGDIGQFKIVENTTMSKELAMQFPEIKAYSGISLHDKTATLKLDITPKGIHAMILSANHSTLFIDPYANFDNENYVVYYKKNFTTSKVMSCEASENIENDEKTANKSAIGDCQLRTYRLAVAATGEYTAFHGGTQALAIAAQVTTMNRVNGIYERELAATMSIVGSNSNIVYTNSSTDPYNNGTPGDMINQCQSDCDNNIGSANYDIGHVFGTNSGGLAGLGVICSNGNKGRGVTGSSAPVGDPFDIDYVAHEIGHQFGGNHTQNNDCNRRGTTSMEPGSGSAIMGYAGICAPNVQNNSDDVFHAISLQEMSNRMLATSCPVVTDNGNSSPVITADQDYTIPASTPFELTGVANDANGDQLTYQWDQMDNAVSTQPPSSTSTDGPNFRVIPHTTNNVKSFPSLTDVINNSNPTWEVLSSVTRDFNFRLMVRDNHAIQGCTAQDDLIVSVDGNSGAFTVTSPNTNVNWEGLTTQNVTWNTANTNSAPVNTSNIDLYLSTDGGNTYSTFIGTYPNNGSASITVPNIATSQARIKAKGNGNVFYDISNANFTITAASNPDFTISINESSVDICKPSNAIFTVNLGSILGYSDPVTLSASGNQIGTNVTFSPNPITPGNTSTMTISNTGAATIGTSTITVSGISTSGTKTDDTQLTISGIPTQVSLSSPANGANNESTSPNLSWGNITDAINYYIQISTDAGFTTIIDNATIATNSYSVSALNISTQYFWRVRAINSCGNGEYSNVFNFTTSNEICNDYNSSNIPVAISSMGTGTYTSTINVNDDINITDLNIIDLVGTHGRLSDLTITLRSPQGTTVELFSGVCGNDDDFDLVFDDASVSSTIACPATSGSSYQPSGSLSNFNGQSSLGVWTLNIVDNRTGFGGNLDSWSMGICGNPPCFAPSINSSPSNSTILENTGTSFSISATGDGLTYQWQVDVDGVGSGTPFVDINDGPIYSSTDASTLTLSNTPLSYNGYTYQCVVTGTCGGAISNSAALTVNSAVVGFSEFSWCWDWTYGKQYGWGAPKTTSTNVYIVPKTVSGATNYTVELNTASDFTGTSIVKSGPSINQSYYLFYYLVPNTTYYVRVSVNGGDWGFVRQFNTHNIGRSLFDWTWDWTYGKQYATNSPVTSTNTYIVPRYVEGASSYTVEINTANDFTGTSITKTGPTTNQSYYLYTYLAQNTTYYVRVMTNIGVWGPVREFTTDNSGTGGSVFDWAWDWTYGKQYGNTNPTTSTNVYVVPRELAGASSYTVELNTANDFTGTSTTKTGSTLNQSNYLFNYLVPNTTYYVRVMTDIGGWGETREFSTHNIGRGMFFWCTDLSYGKQYGWNSPTTKTEVNVVPNTVTGASSYTVELNTANDFTGTSFTKVGSGPTPNWNNYLFQGLNTNTTYYVRVMVDSDPWGITRQLTTDNIAARPSPDRTSPQISIDKELAMQSTYEVYPNPFTNEINLRVDSEKEENLMVRISDLTGKVVYQSTRYQTNQTIQLGEGLEDGMYLIQLVHGDQSQLLKVVKK